MHQITICNVESIIDLTQSKLIMLFCGFDFTSSVTENISYEFSVVQKNSENLYIIMWSWGFIQI